MKNDGPLQPRQWYLLHQSLSKCYKNASPPNQCCPWATPIPPWGMISQWTSSLKLMSNPLLHHPKLRNPPPVPKDQLSSIWRYMSSLVKHLYSMTQLTNGWISLKSARLSVFWTAVEDSTRCSWEPLGAMFTLIMRTLTSIPPYDNKYKDSWSWSTLLLSHGWILIRCYGCEALCASWWYLGSTGISLTGQQQPHSRMVQWPGWVNLITKPPWLTSWHTWCQWCSCVGMNCHPRDDCTDWGLWRVHQPLHKHSLWANEVGAENLMLQWLLELYVGVVQAWGHVTRPAIGGVALYCHEPGGQNGAWCPSTIWQGCDHLQYNLCAHQWG